MGTCTRPVTWLDLAAGPRWGRDCSQLTLHPVSARCGDDDCYVLSMSGRMLCSGDGRLTVFSSRAAVERFLGLLHLETPPLGEHAGPLLDSQGRQDCLCLGGSSLCACRRTAPDPIPVARGRASVYLSSRSSAAASTAAMC